LPEVAKAENCESHLKVPQSFIVSRIRCVVKEVRRYAQEAEPEEEEHQELEKLEVHGDADTELPQVRLPHTLTTAVPASLRPEKGVLVCMIFPHMRVSDFQLYIIPGELVVGIRIRDLRISVNNLLIKYPSCQLLRVPWTSWCLEVHLVLKPTFLLVQVSLQLIFLSNQRGISSVLAVYRPLMRRLPCLFRGLCTSASNLAVIGEVILRLFHRIIFSWP